MRGEAPKMRTGRGFQLLVICLLSLVVIAAGYDGVFGYLLRGAHTHEKNLLRTTLAARRSLLALRILAIVDDFMNSRWRKGDPIPGFQKLRYDPCL